MKHLLILTVIIHTLSIQNTHANLKECLLNILKINSRPKTISPTKYQVLSIQEVERNFQQSDLVIFFDGDQNQATNNLAFLSNEFQLGNTYTALIVNEKLILGKNIYGFVDDSIPPKLRPPAYIGGPGSHMTLFNYYDDKKLIDPTSWVGQSGAIKIGPNGIIDIGGYHFKESNWEAAKKLEKIILKICPNCQLRITDGTLESLPPY